MQSVVMVMMSLVPTTTTTATNASKVFEVAHKDTQHTYTHT